MCNVSSTSSWQPERQVPFNEVRLPPPPDIKKEIGEGDEVEVSWSWWTVVICNWSSFQGSDADLHPQSEEAFSETDISFFSQNYRLNLL